MSRNGLNGPSAGDGLPALMMADQEGEMKMSYAKLRGRIREKFATQAAFAEAIGIDASTLSKKLNGASDWTTPEIEKACSVLEIAIDQVHQYFFCVRSCENAI